MVIARKLYRIWIDLSYKVYSVLTGVTVQRTFSKLQQYSFPEKECLIRNRKIFMQLNKNASTVNTQGRDLIRDFWRCVLQVVHALYPMEYRKNSEVRRITSFQWRWAFQAASPARRQNVQTTYITNETTFGRASCLVTKDWLPAGHVLGKENPFTWRADCYYLNQARNFFHTLGCIQAVNQSIHCYITGIFKWSRKSLYNLANSARKLLVTSLWNGKD